MPESFQSTKTLSTAVDREKLGYPGAPGELLVVPVDAENIDQESVRMNDCLPRAFELTALFDRQLTVPESIDFNADIELGRSFVQLKDQNQIKLTLSNGAAFEIAKNAKEFAAAVLFKCVATSKNDALAQFHKGVGPFLDFLSYLCNVPVAIGKIVGTDKKHNIVFATYIAPYQEVQLVPGSLGLPKDMLPIFSIFREAKNTNSPFYKFLCFAKILEGIFTYVRPRCYATAKASGIKLVIDRSKEVVPNHPELSIAGKQGYVGRPIQELYQGELQPKFRNAIAHFSLDDGDPLLLSDHLVSAEVSNNLLLIELCARGAIETQLGQLTQLVAAGLSV